ncbi:acyl-CoA dehydrogenase [Ampullimonas aquatilis]|uniref:acyl-CoA dehydrogenase n=1 Tax=Ampullimonas aquatilis TaxID=1341549 RepID=UPI003C76378A
MTAYVAPIRDMIHAMREAGNLDEITALPGHEEATLDLVEAILDEAGKFAGAVLAPLNQVGDKQGCQWLNGSVTTPDGFKDAYQQFTDNGWHAMPASIELGGQGLPALVSTAVLEMWTSSNMAFSLCQMLTLGAIMAITHHGSDVQKAQYLPKMVAGTWTGTMNLTEPQAGSDLSAVRSRAVPEGLHYRIFGTKIFITWGEHDVAENIIHLVLARLPDAPPGVKGISLFIVPKFLINEDGSLGPRNDLVCASIEHKMGIHASPTAVMAFGEKEGAVGYLVGEANRGLEYMFTMMNHARLNVGLEGVAISERAYQQAVAYAQERVQSRPIGGKEAATIIHHPDIRRMLLSMKSRIGAMRALTYFAASEMDKAHAHPDESVRKSSQARVDLLIPIVKGWCTESSIDITSLGIQVHGGMGFIEETGAAQHFRDARITAIYEGTTGIQANDLIGRKLAREQGVTAKALMADMSTLLPVLQSHDSRQLQAVGVALGQGIEALSAASDWLIEQYQHDQAAAAAGAVPYLYLFGIVIGGWLLAKGALSQQADAAYLQGQQVLAHFFAEHFMAQVDGYRQSIMQGADPVLQSFENWI